MKGMKTLQKHKGGTLVELMVVCLILAVLVLCALPIYNSVHQQAREAAHDQNVRQLETVGYMWILQNPGQDTEWPAYDGWAEKLEAWPEPIFSPYTVAIRDGRVTVNPGIRDYR